MALLLVALALMGPTASGAASASFRLHHAVPDAAGPAIVDTDGADAAILADERGGGAMRRAGADPFKDRDDGPGGAKAARPAAAEPLPARRYAESAPARAAPTRAASPAAFAIPCEAGRCPLGPPFLA